MTIATILSLGVGEENVSTKSSDVKLTAADYATGLALGVVCFNVCAAAP